MAEDPLATGGWSRYYSDNESEGPGATALYNNPQFPGMWRTPATGWTGGEGLVDYNAANRAGESASNSGWSGLAAQYGPYAAIAGMGALAGVAGAAGAAGGEALGAGAGGVETMYGAGWTPAYGSFTPIPGSLPGPLYGSAASMLGAGGAGASLASTAFNPEFGNSGFNSWDPSSYYGGEPGSGGFDVGGTPGLSELYNFLPEMFGGGGSMETGVGGIFGGGGAGGGSSGGWFDTLKKLYGQVKPYKGMYDVLSGGYNFLKGRQMDKLGAPGRQAGQQLQYLMSNPNAIQSYPGYQARQTAVARQMAARGYNMSGNEMAALAQADQGFRGEEMDRLAKISQGSLPANIASNQLQGNALNRMAYGAYRMFPEFGV